MKGVPKEEVFENEVGVSTWALLKAHFKRGALVLVHPSLDLEEVGNAVVQDDKLKVEAWMTSEKLTPFPIELAKTQPSMKCFIAQPWVLVQEI